jgi:hypothetical protein
MAEQKTAKLCGTDLETRAVRIAMVEEGLSVHQFAARCGMPARHLSASLARNVPHQLTRFRIEAGLAYRRPIWSTFEELEQRRLCVERLGFDPQILGVRELHRRAREIGADFSLCDSKDAMVREVIARAAVVKQKQSSRS